MSMEGMLRNELESQLTELSKMELGTKAYSDTVRGIVLLSNQLAKFEKANDDYNLKVKEIETDADLRRKQMLTDKKVKRADRICNLIGVGIPAGVTVWGILKTLAFEEDGVVKSLITKGFIQKIIPRG